ncbi:MAG: serine/threonine protein kinase [Myxococcales bacterium]|nr:serine/threonine protein kinase [Myxococcales bacterium]MCB9582427.1 serine/threonine protein kinase [Polyangiaceae bacterium]
MDDALSSRTRLYVGVLAGVAGFLHLLLVFVGLRVGHLSLAEALFGPGAVRRGALVVGSTALFLWLGRGRRSRSALLWVDVAAIALVAGSAVLDALNRGPAQRPELASLLLVALALCARAALVPSTGARTFVVGLVGLLPLLLISRSLYHGFARTMSTVAVVGFGLALLAVTATTSHVIYRLRRRVLGARELGAYRLGAKLGEGGMGTVYEAYHALLSRRTALKLVRASEHDEQQLRREAELTSQLSHPNTVALYDYGQTSDGIFYYVMELVDGVTLRELVDQHGPLPAGRVLSLLTQVSASLAQAHSRGLVHRDIKPTNVMVCRVEGYPDCVKVLDFGLALQVHGTADAARAAGTPEYMAPEASYHPERVGPATDVYAVGVLGYFLLTSNVPFTASTLQELAWAHFSQPPLPPSLTSAHSVPRDLEAVLLRCLAKDPKDRYANGGELHEALSQCSASEWSREAAETWWSSQPPVPEKSSTRDVAVTVPEGLVTQQIPSSRLARAHENPSREPVIARI